MLGAASGRATPIATFNTSLGSFQVELRPDVAPLTVQNFLSYVNSGLYNNTLIHRAIPGFVVQGGGFSAAAAPFLASTPPAHIPTGLPVQNEFHLSNVAGTIAMAKISGDPNSATSEWFFNMANNSANLDTQNGGYTVFGDVLGNGMDILNAIVAEKEWNISGVWGGSFGSLPLVNIDLNTATQIAASNLVLINSITVAAPEPGAIVSLSIGVVLVCLVRFGPTRQRQHRA